MSESERPEGMPEPEDHLVAMRAELDQLIAVAPELARVVRGVFDAFKAEGFTDIQALYLTAANVNDQPLSPP
jgi:hypothetical protein